MFKGYISGFSTETRALNKGSCIYDVHMVGGGQYNDPKLWMVQEGGGSTTKMLSPHCHLPVLCTMLLYHFTLQGKIFYCFSN